MSRLLMESSVSGGGRRAWFLGGMIRGGEGNEEGMSMKCLLEERPGAYCMEEKFAATQEPVPELAGCVHEETYSSE